MISALCVDDEQELLDLYKIFLEQSGEIQVDTADSVKMAVGKLKKFRYDIIISDYSMPECDGVAFLKCILPAYGDIPFILFTGKGREEVVIDALNNGARFYVQKGGDPKEKFGDLIHKIKHAVGLKKVEDALRDSEIRYRNLFETANYGILLLDADTGGIIDANVFLLTLIGSSLEEIRGKHLWDIGIFKDIDLGKKAFLELQTKKNTRFESLPLMTKNGQEIAVDFVSNVYSVDQADVIQCNIRDITGRKRAEEALRRERDFAESIIGTAQAIVLILDTEGHIVYMNPYMEEISGYFLEEVKGKDWFETFLPSHLQESVRSLFQKAVGDIQTRGNVGAIITRDGRERLIEWYDKTLKNADGSVEGLLAIGQDVTERKRAEEALRSALAEKEMLLREIHHRVKNNITEIISLIELQIISLTDSTQIHLLKDLKSRIRSMALVHESLYLAEDLAWIDIATYTENLIRSLFQVYGTGADIRLRIEMGDVTIPPETAIPCGLVMSEVVTNSLKYAFPKTFSCAEIRGEPCTIALTLHREGNDYLLKIADNGTGMPEGIDDTMSPSLGLYLIRIIVTHQLRGSLEISTAGGTAYTIRFPDPVAKEYHADE